MSVQAFERLLQVADMLLSPQGCPWDQTQTFVSLQPYVLEEAHEVIEAVDADDDGKIIEELGDLLYTVIFYGKVAEKTGRFRLEAVLHHIREKLIRRHPHVFGDVKVLNEEDVIKNWEAIKAVERGDQAPRALEAGIPPTLPALPRAQKIVTRLMRRTPTDFAEENFKRLSDVEVGDQLVRLVVDAEKSGVDAEGALRRALERLQTSV